MRQGDYGTMYEQLVISPLTQRERQMIRTAKNQYNARTGKHLCNREYRKLILVEGAVRELTGVEDDKSCS